MPYAMFSCLDLLFYTLICLDLHALGFMPCFPFYVDVRLHAHMLDIMSMVMSCLDLHVCMHILCFYAYIRVFTCLYAWIHVLPCLRTSFLHVHLNVFMLICLDLCFHMPMCLDLCSLHTLCYLPCACVLHAMFVCLGLDLFVMPCAIVALLSHYLSFLRFGLWSLSSSIHLGPYQRVWITRFSCLCFLSSMLYACVIHSCFRLCHA